jgi:hypothetical protein
MLPTEGRLREYSPDLIERGIPLAPESERPESE